MQIRQKSKTKLKKAAGIALIVLAAAAALLIFAKKPDVPEFKNPLPNGGDSSEYVPATVVYVVDGDTVFARTPDYPDGVKVRYLGIDCPESVNYNQSKNSEEGQIASERNKELIAASDKKIYLEFDENRFDQYDRMLAYVWVYDKDSQSYVLAEEKLLSEGLCETLFYEPNDKYSDYFYGLEKEAKKNKTGFYGTGYYR